MNKEFDLESIKKTPHHKAMEELTDILCHKTGNINRQFFQTEIAYFLGLIPSSMRAKIISPERGNLPINIYSIALATSGFGKGHSINIMEDLICDFRNKFMQTIFPDIAEKSLYDIAVEIASAKGGDENEENVKLTKDFKRQGHSPFIFDSGTSPAVKQLRYKLLLARIGSINFQMDEIGSNLVSNNDVLNVLLELYDLGKVKTKLVKNTTENERGIDVIGSTPSNALMFGTTSKLFDGSKTEEEFFSFLETGYARRCFFGIGKPTNLYANVRPEDLYDSLISKQKSLTIDYWKNQLSKFADLNYYNLSIKVPKDVGIELISYRLFCEKLANKLPEHETIRKAELSHRYFKSLKLAGVYAFLDKSSEITLENLYQAIKVAEESGESFDTLLKRERNFVRLAKYIADSPGELTHADLVEDLPYYPSATTPRKEIMDLAMAWGVSNHVVIKKKIVQSVEFFIGSNLEETNTNLLKFSFSEDFASDYSAEKKSLDTLPKLLKAPNFHWCNHYFDNDHRAEDNVIEGFNMLVVDVDGTISLDACHDLLKNYTFITSTTKRHTEDCNRFRLIMPTNYNLNLDRIDYKEFMNSFLLWLPFESDQSANQRSKKWMTNSNSIINVNEGNELINVLPFIPKTKQNAEYSKSIADLENLDNLERWFLNEIELGNRNNNLLKFAMMLKDSGVRFKEIANKVFDLNDKSKTPLKKSEIETTILKSVGKKMNEELN